MKALMTVKELMPHVKNCDSKYVILISACSNYGLYSDFYSNFPEEMKELNVTLIEFESNYIKLYVL